MSDEPAELSEPRGRAHEISRRSFLAAAAGAGASVAVSTAVGPQVGDVRGADARLAPDSARTEAVAQVGAPGRPVFVPFEGRRQAGIDRPAISQGLFFLAYQRDLGAGFLAVQARLHGEPLEESIRPVGGGFFFTLPGVMGEGRYLGDGPLA